MAKRHNPNHSALARQKIRASYLVNRLQAHVRGKIQLTPTQVRAIEILLKKIVPDLNQTTITADVQHSYVVEVPPLLTRDEWSRKYRAPRPQLPKAPEPQLPPTLDLEAEPTLPLITKQ